MSNVLTLPQSPQAAAPKIDVPDVIPQVAPHAMPPEIGAREVVHKVIVSLDSSWIDFISDPNKKKIVDLLTEINPKVSGNWLDTHQVFATGLCAITTALIAFAGVWLTTRTQRIIEGDRYDKAQAEKRAVCAKKKSFLVFDIIQAFGEVDKFVNQIAQHLTYVDEGDAPDEYYVFRSDLTLAEQSDLYFKNIYDALERISIKKSAYPIQENEIQYLSDEELELLNDLDFRIKSLQTRSREIQAICKKLLISWVPEGLPDTDFQRFVQDDAQKLVQNEIKLLISETKRMVHFTVKFAKIFASAIGSKYEADIKAKRRKKAPDGQ